MKMYCKLCDGSLEEDNLQKICTNCGTVQDGMFLVDSVGNNGNEFTYFESNQSSSYSYKMFVKLFNSISSQLTGGPKVVIPEATLLLPKLWSYIKTHKIRDKKAFLYALLYLLYRQRVSAAISVNQFCKTSGFDKFLHKHAAMLQDWFELPIMTEDKISVISETIRETVQVSFKKPNPVLIKETEGLALRIGKVIHEQGLYNIASSSYVACVAAAACHISSEYMYKNQKCKIKLTGVNTGWFNFEKVCSYLCIGKFSLWKVLREIKQKLFETAMKLPVKCPPSVKRYNDVYIVIQDICDYLEYYKEEDTTDDIAVKTPVIPLELKKCVIRSLNKLLFSNAEVKHEHSKVSKSKIGLHQKSSSYDINFKKLKLQIIDDFVSNGVACKILNENVNNISEKDIILDRSGNFDIGGYSIRREVLEFIRDILRAGCSLEELYINDFVSLSKQYLERIENEENLSELSDNELELYFNDSFVESQNKKIRIS
ncbi:uncharacterized protein LOC105843359 isoform X1 [Hydra vulgaris]|uniref:uncharacterized protein LOC105843359 isoform X1 n=2 Tax=Hydra vulgaris TaxID=6087 RepID=UPI0001923FC8|nr:uncharacterized protein LOC105843359 isoform X1 [Hydra vulgaris]